MTGNFACSSPGYGICFRTRAIPPGTFLRGTTDDEPRRENVPDQFGMWEQPRRLVTIREAFEIGRYPGPP
jgi:formylglycine-generating enzyme required for sulfatase activity